MFSTENGVLQHKKSQKINLKKPMYFSLIILIKSHCEMAVFVLWTLFNDWKNQTLFEKKKMLSRLF